MDAPHQAEKLQELSSLAGGIDRAGPDGGLEGWPPRAPKSRGAILDKEARMNKRMPKIDMHTQLSGVFLKQQFDGEELHKLVSRRKKLPYKPADMWTYNRMHQKDIFSEPLVHDTSVRTIERIWEKALGQIKQGEEVDVSNKRKGNVGQKNKDLGLSRALIVPLNKRKTIRGLAMSLGIARSTLHKRFQMGKLVRRRSSLKPVMTQENKIKRLKFCVSMLEQKELTYPRPSFQLMDNIVHIDEKWFDMTRKNNNYYLLPEESLPLRTVWNKNNIGKVMFLTAVAKPRFVEGGAVTFDGKISTWAFVQEKPAIKNSKNRDKGTLELKSVKVTRDVMREYLCEKLIPAIQERWPDEDEKRTIFIQQDNAKPHLLPGDKAFLQVVAKTNLKIRLLQQPPNSPDMNVLDLCFFRSLQSLTDTRAPTTIKELIEGVQEEYHKYDVKYHKYDVKKLARSFLTLQYYMVEVMKLGGGVFREAPHKKKEIRQAEGLLPIATCVTEELLAQTLALIAAG